MARLTNAQLSADLEAAHVAYQKLEQRFASVCEERNALLEAAKTLAKPAQRFYVPSKTPAQLAAHDAYVAKCLAAKKLAMESGRVTSVQ